MCREEYRKKILPKSYQSSECLAERKTLIFDLGKYIQYTKIVKILREQLAILIDDLEFNFELNEMIANDVIITSEI